MVEDEPNRPPPFAGAEPNRLPPVEGVEPKRLPVAGLFPKRLPDVLGSVEFPNNPPFFSGSSFFSPCSVFC